MVKYVYTFDTETNNPSISSIEEDKVVVSETGSTLEDIIAETDKIPLIKIETDKIPEVLNYATSSYADLVAIKIDTDKIDSIKSETDKIETILNLVSSSSSSSLELAAIQVETDKIPLIKTETDKIPLIKTETDKIPSIKTQTDFLTSTATIPASTTVNSIAHRITRIQSWLHGRDRWMGVAAVPDGEIHAADSVSAGALPFIFTSGAVNSTYGPWVLVSGSSDTPRPNMAWLYFMVGNWLCTDTNSTEMWLFQAAVGPDTATRDYLISIGSYSEVAFKTGSTTNDAVQYYVRTPLLPVGIKVWMRALTVGAAGRTFNGYYAIHGYES